MLGDTMHLSPALLTEGIVWHVPGRGAISGVYRGKAQVMEYMRRRRDLADDTFEITVDDVLANDQHGFVIASGRATRHGKCWNGVHTACIGSRAARLRSAGYIPKIKSSSMRSDANRPLGPAAASQPSPHALLAADSRTVGSSG